MHSAEHSSAVPSTLSRSPPETRRSGANRPPRRRSSPSPCRADCAREREIKSSVAADPLHTQASQTCPCGSPDGHSPQAQQSIFLTSTRGCCSQKLMLPQASTCRPTRHANQQVGPPGLNLHALQPKPAQPGRKNRCPILRRMHEPNGHGQKFGAFRTDARDAINPSPRVGKELSALPEFLPRPFFPLGLLKHCSPEIPKGRETNKAVNVLRRVLRQCNRNAEHLPAAPSALSRSPSETRRSGANRPPRRRSSPSPCIADCARDRVLVPHFRRERQRFWPAPGGAAAKS